jgi:indolepyruvate ferredoxin oxidoreductase beta subunit
MMETLSQFFDVKAINATDIAAKNGNIQAANVVMIGAASHYIPFSENTFKECIAALVPPKFLEINLKAFQAGRESIQK